MIVKYAGPEYTKNINSQTDAIEAEMRAVRQDEIDR